MKYAVKAFKNCLHQQIPRRNVSAGLSDISDFIELKNPILLDLLPQYSTN